MVTFQIVPYSEIENLSSIGRIRKILNIAKEKKIVMLQGRLKKEEEAELIKATMEEINKDFKGIDLAVLESFESNKSVTGFQKLKMSIINKMLGDRQGLTIVGPASVVQEIKKDPTKIELIIKDNGKKSRKKRK